MEPKFKVGDIITHNGEIRTIYYIQHDIYYMVTDNGGERNGCVGFGDRRYTLVESAGIETRVNKKGSSFNLLVKNLDETQLKEVEEFVKNL